MRIASGTGETARAIVMRKPGNENNLLAPAINEIPPPPPINMFPGRFTNMASAI